MTTDSFKGLKDNEFASFSNVFSTVKSTTFNGIISKEKKEDTLNLDSRKIAGALAHRDYVNQLMGF